MSVKLIRMLQSAHAGELAAFYAYEGHWKSLKSDSEREAIKKIQREEMEHIKLTEVFLEGLRAKPSPIKDYIFTKIGKTIGFLCHWTGWTLPMKVAGLMEKIGAYSYKNIAKEAWASKNHQIVKTLNRMQTVEIQHEDYFNGLLRGKSSCR